MVNTNEKRKTQRDRILERDNYTCQECGIKVLSKEEQKRVPHIHHKDKNRSHNKDPNLETLCRSCHNGIPRGPNSSRPLLPLPGGVQFFTLRRASILLGMHSRTLHNWADRGWVKFGHYPNGRRSVNREEIERLRGLLSGIPEPVDGNPSPQPQ